MLKTLVEGCTPTKGSKYSAAVDLYAAEDVVIGAGETKIVGLGVAIDDEALAEIVPMVRWAKNKWTTQEDEERYRKNETDMFMKKHYLQLEPRSSLRAKGIQAGTGIIDIDYPDEIKIILHNPITVDMFGYRQNEIQAVDFAPENFNIKKGDRIAQILLKEHNTYLLSIDTEDKRTGGFGSTGE